MATYYAAQALLFIVKIVKELLPRKRRRGKRHNNWR